MGYGWRAEERPSHHPIDDRPWKYTPTDSMLVTERELWDSAHRTIPQPRQLGRTPTPRRGRDRLAPRAKTSSRSPHAAVPRRAPGSPPWQTRAARHRRHDLVRGSPPARGVSPPHLRALDGTPRGAASRASLPSTLQVSSPRRLAAPHGSPPAPTPRGCCPALIAAGRRLQTLRPGLGLTLVTPVLAPTGLVPPARSKAFPRLSAESELPAWRLEAQPAV